MGGITGEIVRLPGRALQAEDDFFKAVAYRMELRTLAARDGLHNLCQGSSPASGGRCGGCAQANRQPMSTAKAIVKDWSRRHRSWAIKPPPRDERTVLIEAACAMELGHAWPAGRRAEAA